MSWTGSFEGLQTAGSQRLIKKKIASNCSGELPKMQQQMSQTFRQIVWIFLMRQEFSFKIILKHLNTLRLNSNSINYIAQIGLYIFYRNLIYIACILFMFYSFDCMGYILLLKGKLRLRSSVSKLSLCIRFKYHGKLVHIFTNLPYFVFCDLRNNIDFDNCSFHKLSF